MRPSLLLLFTYDEKGTGSTLEGSVVTLDDYEIVLFSLSYNKTANFSLPYNKQSDDSLSINKQINFTLEK